jgi:RNA polymerase sigma-70 factor, ECF subfamily
MPILQPVRVDDATSGWQIGEVLERDWDHREELAGVQFGLMLPPRRSDDSVNPGLQKPVESDADIEFAVPAAQPEAKHGVLKDMGTLAVHPGMLNAREASISGRHVAESPISIDLTPEQMEARRIAVARGDFSELTDAEAMLELRAGNMAGFDILLAKYRKPIVHFMFRMVHNQAVAEELAQEVFLRIYRSRETYRAEARFSTWLYRIATNLGVNHARDTRNERIASTVYLDEPDAETGTTPDVMDLTPSAEAELLRRERLKAIRLHVIALPERQKTAVLMHKYEGMDYKQIGEVLKLSESATKSLLFRAYQTLREKLKEFV